MLTPPTVLERFDPSREAPDPDEAKTAEALAETMLSVSDKTFEDTGEALRSVHAKSHGLLKASLEVFPDLPAPLAQGLFAKPATYPAVMRFSTIPGDILPDDVSTPRGLAVKIVGVEGDRLPGSEGAVTQDFVMVNGPVANAPNGKVFLANMKMLAATTDKIEGVKEGVSAVLQRVEKLIETFGGQSPTFATLGGQQPVHILGETFYSQLPIRYGDYIAKISVAPESPELQALIKAKIDLKEDEDAIRLAVVDFFSRYGASWLVRVQLCTNLDDMPIDKPMKRWDEEESPFIPVGRLTAEPQVAWSPARSQAVDDGMGFSPWHGLASHQPLGELMRLRKVAYARSQAARSARGSVPITEPTTLDSLPA